MFIVHSESLEMLKRLGPVVAAIRKQDRSLADQVRRAASSIVLNIAEAEGTTRGNQRLRFETALGSAKEVRAALNVAVCWGYLPESRHVEIDKRLDKVCAMLWRLAHPR